MKGSPRLTEDELQRFGESVSDALTIVVGLMAEAVGRRQFALHFASAYSARQQTRPDHVRDSLLLDALRLVLVKARNAHPDDPDIQTLAASVLGEQKRH